VTLIENDDDQETVIKFERSSVKKLVTRLAVLIVVCSIIITSVILYAPRSEGYNEMYIKVQSQTNNSLTQGLAVEQNNTFDVQVVVVNNTPILSNYQIQVKIVKDTFSFPANAPVYETYEFVLDSEQSWNKQVPIALGEEGNFSVVFELFAEKEGVYRFTDIYCVQHVTVI
jgi:uncharacterized membrane protein